MRKRLLSALLVLCMALTLLPMSALAAKYTVNFEGQDIEIEVDDTTGQYQETQLSEYYAIAPGTITLGADKKMPLKYDFAYYHYNGAPGTYTIQGSLVNLPATEIGTEVEASEDGSATASNGTASAKLPAELGGDADKVDLSSVTVGVTPKDTIESDKIDTGVSEDIKTAIQAEGTKFVEVTIKATASGNELFNTKDALKDTPITISIGGLVSGKAYYLFCIMDDGNVTSYGYVTPTGTSISFTTRHLCVFGAAPVDALTEAQQTALKAAVLADAENIEEGTTVTGGTLEEPKEAPVTPTDAKVTLQFTSVANGADAKKFYSGKLTVKNPTDGAMKYVVALDNGVLAGTKKLSICQVLELAAGESVDLDCMPSLSVTIWEATTDTVISSLYGKDAPAPIVGGKGSGVAVNTLTAEKNF